MRRGKKEGWSGAKGMEGKKGLVRCREEGRKRLVGWKEEGRGLVRRREERKEGKGWAIKRMKGRRKWKADSTMFCQCQGNSL